MGINIRNIGSNNIGTTNILPIGKNFRRASSRKRHRHCTLPGLNPPVVGHAASCPAQNARGDSRLARLDEPPHLNIVIDEIIKYYSADGFFWSNAKPSEVARSYQTSVAKVHMEVTGACANADGKDGDKKVGKIPPNSALIFCACTAISNHRHVRSRARCFSV